MSKRIVPKSERKKDGTAYSTKYPNIYEYWNGRSNRWMYRVRLTYYIGRKKKEHSKSGLFNLAEAKKHLAQVENEIKTSSSAAKKFERKKKAQETTWYELYVDLKKKKVAKGSWAKKTAYDNDNRAKVLKEYFGNEKIIDIDAEMVQYFIDDFYDRGGVKGIGVKQSTMHQYLKLLWEVLNYAVKKNIIKYHDTKHVDYEQDDYKPQDRTITDEEFTLFKVLAEDQLSDLYYTMFDCLTYGLRVGEIPGMKIENLHFLDDGKSIYAPDIAVSALGEGELKTESSYRYVAFSKETTQRIQRQIERARDILKSKGRIMHETNYIFLNPDTDKSYRPKVIYSAVKRIAKQVNPDISPHWFRHYFATDALAKGVDSMALQKVLGHSNLQETNRYAKSSKRNALQVLDMLNNDPVNNTVKDTVK